MKQPYQDLKAIEHGLEPHLHIRHYPDTFNEYLSYQIGEMVTRRETSPIFDCDNRVIGANETGKLTSVFHLQAWGSSLEAAKNMWFARQAQMEATV
jgi:hypothetical protein